MPRKSNPMVKYIAVSAAPRKRKTAKSTAAPKRTLRGRGDYTYGDKSNMGPWERAGRGIGGVLGQQFLGDSKLGSKIGSYLHYIGKIFGSGDYVTSPQAVKNNVLVNESQTPQFGVGKNTVHVKHREFLGDVYSSATPGAFNLQSFPINPGNYKTFPWLSQVCGASFQQYRINGMVFEFRSMSADALNSTNTALGSVVMSTDYDSKDSLFTSKQQMENTEFGISCKPSSCAIHAIECARNQTSVSELYIRAFDVPEGADIRLYDMGNFQIATVGMQAASVNLGELWVSYDITLIKTIEQVPNYIAPVAQYALGAVGSSSALGVASGQPTKLIDEIGLQFKVDTGTDVCILPYQLRKDTIFSVYYGLHGQSTASVAEPAWTLSGGLSFYASYASHPVGAAVTTDVKFKYHVLKYDGTGTASNPPTIAFLGGIVPATLTGKTLSITEISGNYKPDGF